MCLKRELVPMNHRDFQLEVAHGFMGCPLPMDFGKRAATSAQTSSGQRGGRNAVAPARMTSAVDLDDHLDTLEEPEEILLSRRRTKFYAGGNSQTSYNNIESADSTSASKKAAQSVPQCSE